MAIVCGTRAQTARCLAMRYHSVEPEVAGGLGPRTVMDRRSHPPIVKRLHYVMDGWLGDELLESFPVFVVTESLRDNLNRSGLTGVLTEDVEVTLSDEFQELYPNRTVPSFVWLKITGCPGVHDFGIAEDHRLVVSHRALELMNLKHAVVASFPSTSPTKAAKQ
jgi:hypothetical protein